MSEKTAANLDDSKRRLAHNPANSVAGFWGTPASQSPEPDDRELEHIHYWLYEEYKTGRYGSTLKERLKDIYYNLKPMLPRTFQIYLRSRWRKKVQDKITFPSWPIDLSLYEYYLEGLEQLKSRDPALSPAQFWPGGIRSVAVATHDVEGPPGLEKVLRLARLEADLDIPALFNFVPHRSRPDPEMIRELRAMGHDVGVHGFNHDGRLFRDPGTFRRRLPDIGKYARLWEAEGFRSPATHRHPLWMQDLPVQFDTSFFDTDPYEIQYGGTLSLFPFFLGKLVELPVTLVQDHTVFEILEQDDLQLWYEKSKRIMDIQGMILWIVHPDYIFEKDRLEKYHEFLLWLRDQAQVGFMPARSVAKHWKNRALKSGWLQL